MLSWYCEVSWIVAILKVLIEYTFDDAERDDPGIVLLVVIAAPLTVPFVIAFDFYDYYNNSEH